MWTYCLKEKLKKKEGNTVLKNGIKTLKHIAVGMTGGMILGIILCCFFSCKNKIKSKVSKAIHALGDIIEQIPYMFK